MTQIEFLSELLMIGTLDEIQAEISDRLLRLRVRHAEKALLLDDEYKDKMSIHRRIEYALKCIEGGKIAVTEIEFLQELMDDLGSHRFFSSTPIVYAAWLKMAQRIAELEAKK